MYNIIPFFLILISLSAIIIIVIRKFSALATLDVGSIQQEKEARIKEQIISNRFKKIFVKWGYRTSRIARPTGRSISSFLKWISNKLIEVKDNYTKEEATEPADIKARIEELFLEAQDRAKKEEYDEAEKKYIEIISLDSKNIKTFKMLGRLYSDIKNYQEAKQTFEHTLKLLDDMEDAFRTPDETQGKTDEEIQTQLNDINSERSSIYYDLTLACRAMENIDEAIATMKKALKLEPNNPRYLDTILEIGIINKDKIIALDAYNKLKEVNAENNKLEEFKKQIDEL